MNGRDKNDYFRRLVRGRANSVLERLEAMQEEEADPQAAVKAARDFVERAADSPSVSDAMRTAVTAGKDSVEILASAAGAYETLDNRQKIGLEALVELTGRPSLVLCKNGFVKNDPMLEEWPGLYYYQNLVAGAAASVGRIDLNGVHIGTGWVYAENVIVTNRHVLQAIAREYELGGKKTWILKPGKITINFVAEHCAGPQSRFVVKRVVAAGPDPIVDPLDMRRLDAAMLEIEPTSIEGGTCPMRLEHRPQDDLLYLGQFDIGAIGYPGPAAASLAAGPVEPDVQAALYRVFGTISGVKRFAPGKARARGLEGYDYWLIDHDASTLPGASGAALVAMTLGEPAPVVGLHFAGETRKTNTGHGAWVLKQL